MAKAFQQQLIDAVNDKNTSLDPALTVADVDFGAVAEFTGEAGRNTKITLTAKEESQHFKGEKEFHYTRLSCDIVGEVEVTAPATDFDSAAKILAKVNAAMAEKGYTDDEFGENDLQSISREEEGKTIYVVTVVAGHLKFLPGTVATYKVTPPAPPKVALSGLEGELDGFTAPSPKE
ncbi:hypothetical protein DRV66_09985 [Salmonella enterica subsp. enterica serovar Chester]|nr:hypothetical protein [Salmonella enterica subsp. enterica serovar Chester]